MESPTGQLVQVLSALGLASPSDFRRCSGTVRRLTGGLPVTDSIWIDALVSSGKLTPYQAQALESNRSDELVVGRKFLIRNSRHLDPLLSLFEASSPGRRERFLISRMTCPSQSGDATVLRLLKTIKSLTTCRGQVPGLPFDALLEHERLFLLAPMQAGESLSRLMIRRGRFPEEVVRKLAVQLIQQLHVTESFAAHGDLRPANVWLTRQGEVVLLNFGLLDAAEPEINIHSQLPLDAYDGMAPERIEAGTRATPVSDVYGLGCLLWQLLTGRPPHAVADPLAKLTAHRLKQIPDVRTLAPEVSESFALLIRSLTAREPHRRPQTCADVRASLGSGYGRDRFRLQRFVRQFESAAPRQISDEKSKSRIPALATAALVTIGLILAAWNREQLGWGQLTRASAAVSVPTKTVTEADTKLTSGSEENRKTTMLESSNLPMVSGGNSSETLNAAPQLPPLLPLPNPDLQGVIVLSSSQDYLASEVITGESLHLLGDPDQPATIHVRESAFILEADNVRLENVRLIVDAVPDAPRNQSPIQVRAQTLAIHHCWLGWKTATAVSVLLQWSARDETAPRAGRLLISDSVLLTASKLLCLETPLSAALLENVLTHGSGTLLDLQAGIAADLRVPLMLNGCTFRECGPVVKLPGGSVLGQSGRLSLQGGESVIDLAQGEPFLEVTDPESSPAWQPHLEIAAEGLIVEVGMILAGHRRLSSGTYSEASSEGLQVDGLLLGDFHFEPADSSGSEADRLVIDSLPVRDSSRVPGVEQNRLPTAGE